MSELVPFALVFGMMTGYVLSPVPITLLKLLEESALFKILVLVGAGMLSRSGDMNPEAMVVIVSWSILIVVILDYWRKNDAENVVLQPDSLLI